MASDRKVVGSGFESLGGGGTSVSYAEALETLMFLGFFLSLIM